MNTLDKKNISVLISCSTLDLTNKTSTTFLLIEEGLLRGYNVVLLKKLILKHNKLFARVSNLHYEDGNIAISDTNLICVSDMIDIVLIRDEPPFDINYLTLTYLLDFLPKNILCINNPYSLRNYTEKISIKYFPQLILPTIITNDIDEIVEFAKSHNSIVIKNLYDGAGKNINLIHYNGDSQTLLNDIKKINIDSNYIMIQKFNNKISEGDKRVLLLNGEFLGSFNRIPSPKNFLANMAQGGSIEKTIITDKDKKIISSIKNFLIEHKLIFVGIDIIDGYITEINSTSPTGISQINKLYNDKLESKCWDCFIYLLKEIRKDNN